MYFRFWGTCADHAGLLHRYIHGKVVCCLYPPITYIWYFSPCYPSPPSPTPVIPPLAPHNWSQCVMLPSLCPHILIVQHPPMSENMWCLGFCSCVSLLRMMVSSFIHPCPYKGHDLIFSLSSMEYFFICVISDLFEKCFVVHVVKIFHLPG